MSATLIECGKLPIIEPNKVYTKTEAAEILLALLSLNPTSANFETYTDENLAWLNKLPPNSCVSWEEDRYKRCVLQEKISETLLPIP
jgi:hypothetical protein